MATTHAPTNGASGTASRTGIPTRLEVVILPVSDAARARDFYTGLGWRLDADSEGPDGYHIVQVTPPGSNTSVILGTGVTAATPGTGGAFMLVVDDIERARDELRSRGADVSEIFHDVHDGFGAAFHPTTDHRAPGPDPQGRSYTTFASFRDPDGNEWLIQEIKERLPGRIAVGGVDDLAQLLHETAEHHDAFEKASPPHDWWDWYAAYFDARQRGADPSAAEAAADTYMADVKGVVAHRG